MVRNKNGKCECGIDAIELQKQVTMVSEIFGEKLKLPNLIFNDPQTTHKWNLQNVIDILLITIDKVAESCNADFSTSAVNVKEILTNFKTDLDREVVPKQDLQEMYNYLHYGGFENDVRLDLLQCKEEE